MTFSCGKSSTSHDLSTITTFSAGEIEQVTQYKYLGTIVDDSLTFTPHWYEKYSTD